MAARECFEYAGVRYGVRRRCAGGAPVALVHGFAQSAATWDDAAPLLACGRAVHALDLVGHGASDRPDGPTPYALDAQAEALLAFLASVAADGAAGAPDPRPVVVGYSMGGRVALAAAAARPQVFARRVGGLVLESVGLGPADESERADAAERDARNAAALRRDGLAVFMDAWERLPLFATQRELPAAVRERVRAGRLANDAEALARTFEHAGQHAMPDRAAVLAALALLRDSGTPVLYLAGSRDAKYRALAEQLAAEDLCTTRIIEGAGHNVHLEAPDAFARALEDFLG